MADVLRWCPLQLLSLLNILHRLFVNVDYQCPIRWLMQVGFHRDGKPMPVFEWKFDEVMLTSCHSAVALSSWKYSNEMKYMIIIYHPGFFIWDIYRQGKETGITPCMKCE